MRLRERTRLPGRYREDEVEELPRPASFAHPTVPFNPHLPEAAFPTLEYPRPVQAVKESSPADILEVNFSLQIESDVQQKEVSRPATVFHDTRKSRNSSLVSIGSTEIEDAQAATQAPDVVHLGTVADPDEWDNYGIQTDEHEDRRESRVGLDGCELHLRWSELTDKTKFAVVMVLAEERDINEVVDLLCWTAEDQAHFCDLQEKETEREQKETADRAAFIHRQNQIVLSGAFAMNQESYRAALENDLYAGHPESLTSSITKKEIRQGRTFLKDHDLDAYCDQLWTYFGVDVGVPMGTMKKAPVACILEVVSPLEMDGKGSDLAATNDDNLATPCPQRSSRRDLENVFPEIVDDNANGRKTSVGALKLPPPKTRSGPRKKNQKRAKKSKRRKQPQVLGSSGLRFVMSVEEETELIATPEFGKKSEDVREATIPSSYGLSDAPVETPTTPTSHLADDTNDHRAATMQEKGLI